MIKAFIIEDEPMARRNLENLLRTHFPYVTVIGWAASVRDSLLWISEHGSEADVIFMDVELQDGDCFEIFRAADIPSKVIMTTAYDNYAVKAFKVRSLDYLLKPVEVEDMRRAPPDPGKTLAGPAAGKGRARQREIPGPDGRTDHAGGRTRHRLFLCRRQADLAGDAFLAAVYDG